MIKKYTELDVLLKDGILAIHTDLDVDMLTLMKDCRANKTDFSKVNIADYQRNLQYTR